MAWNDDSWRDGYDAWKLASPDDDYDEPECDHEDFDIDILDGRARCNRCSESWHATEDEIRAQIEHMARYAEYEEREERRQWWRDLWDRIKSPFQRLRPVKRGPILDDDIPF